MKWVKWSASLVVISLVLGCSEDSTQENQSNQAEVTGDTGRGESWVDVAENGEDRWRVKLDSIEKTQLGGELALSAILEFSHKEAGVQYSRAKIPIADCENGVGTLVTERLDGSPISEADYVAGGQNIASIVADFLCQTERYVSTEIKKTSGL